MNGISKINLLRVLVCIAGILILQPVYGQVPITVSDRKTVVDGKSYYLHTVKQGETLYSISNTYNISQKDIAFNNPEAFEGIRVGQELKIPVKPGEKTNGGLFESAQFIYHITEKGQTVYSLIQQYRVSLEVLYKHNPELEHAALQAGQVVTIPKAGRNELQQDKPVTYSIHKVKRKETLFSIAKSYDTDLNRIFEANPEIDANNPKIKTGQDIKIPLLNANPAGGIQVGILETDTVEIPKTVVSDLPVIQADSAGCVQTAQKSFRIALLLPFFLADNFPASPPDSSMVKDEEGRYRLKNGQYWIHPRSVNGLEFYEGALLAIDSLKKAGIDARVHVFDTMRDSIKMAQILQSPVMKEVDLIIGPFFTELVNQVARFAQENKIFYVSPVALNAGSLQNNPYLMQVNAGEINAVGPVVNFISRQENVHVTLIGDKYERNQALFQAYQNRLKSALPDTSLTIHQFRTDSLIQANRYLKKQKLNVVIIPVADEALVNILTAQLYAASHSYKVNLYGLAAWTKFVNLDLEYFHTLEFRYASAFYIDYNRLEVQHFLRQFRKYYQTEPTMRTGLGSVSSYAYQFAFLGYDATFYFASALQKYGRGFGSCIPIFRLPLLQSDFRFTKTDPYSGYMNTHLDIYRYTRDYTVTKENIDPQ